jgi:hypothetical protein
VNNVVPDRCLCFFFLFFWEDFFLNLLLSLECDGVIVRQDTAFVKNSGNTTTVQA